ncbi:hypothetical protein [Nostoc sp. 106C]|uniref:hypothetical protein n=1 Tax=Nostoc sp. 106C TaxID=1932667 RepID=UPI000A39515E|nr:hypothetical protein [Nostoc sp. 106C]OUL22058.1 hypothetical protein BV375_28150 [Nostoc sp. 106C]
MNSITQIATTTLVLLLSYTSNPVFAVPQTPNHPVTVAQAKKVSDNLIIPGERVGPVTRKTTKQDLVKLFGASCLVDKTISGAEGIGSFAATQVNLGKERSFLVVWSDQTRTKPLSIDILGSGWKTPEGLSIGTPLSELRKKLGNFQLFGLGWDYSGVILLKTSQLSRYLGKLSLQVDAAPSAYKNHPKDYQAVSGDGTFSSSDPHWQPLGIRISEINVVLNPEQ